MSCADPVDRAVCERVKLAGAQLWGPRVTPNYSTPSYDVVAGIRTPLASFEVRDHRMDECEIVQIIKDRVVLGAALSSFPTPSVGRYDYGALRKFSNIGDVVFIPSDIPWQLRSGGGRFRTITGEFSSDVFKSVTQRDDDWSERELIACHNIQEGQIRKLLGKISEEVQHPGFASNVLTDSLAIQLLVYLQRHFQAVQERRASTAGLDPAQIAKVRDYIAEHSGSQVMLGDLAELCGMHSRTFMRRFKITTGQTVSAFVAEQQLVKAKTLLRETDMPLKQIAYRLGFSSPSNFSTAFRRSSGVSPAKYRRTAA